MVASRQHQLIIQGFIDGNQLQSGKNLQDIRSYSLTDTSISSVSLHYQLIVGFSKCDKSIKKEKL